MDKVSYKRAGMMSSYVNQMTSILEGIYPDKDRDELEEIVRREARKGYKEKGPTVEIDEKKIPINSMDRYVIMEDLIVAGSGSLYQQHEGSTNILAEMISFLTSNRKAYQKLMHESRSKGDKLLTDRYNVIQTVIKLFNNSLYGVLTQANSIFFNPLSGPSITESGQDITTTSAITFERFLASNFFFENINDAFVYVSNILGEEYTEFEGLKIKIIPNVDMVLDRLLSKIDNYSEYEEDLLFTYISNRSDEELTKIYYKDNLIEFINDTNVFELCMSNPTERDDFLDPNDPPEEILGELEMMWEILKTHVVYNYNDYYRYENMYDSEQRPRKRRAVLMMDTDSNFLQLNKLVGLLSKKQNVSLDTVSFDQRLTIVNTLMYACSQLIANVYHKYTNGLGIHDEKSGLISMTNEYYYSRMMLTRNKKNYAGKIMPLSL